MAPDRGRVLLSTARPTSPENDQTKGGGRSSVPFFKIRIVLVLPIYMTGVYMRAATRSCLGFRSHRTKHRRRLRLRYTGV